MRTASIVFTLGTAVVVLHANIAPAAIKSWIDGTGNWNVPANWSGGTTPALNDVVNIVNADGVARNVEYDVSAPSLGLLSIDLTGTGATTNTLSISSNSTLQANAIVAGGYSGAGFTNGRGAVNQSAGMIADDQVITKTLDGAQEIMRLGPHVPVQKLVAVMVEIAQVHPLGMQIHAAIVSVLAVVESHPGPRW